MALAVLTAAVLHALLPEELQAPAVALAAVGGLRDPGASSSSAIPVASTACERGPRVVTDILIALITLANAYSALHSSSASSTTRASSSRASCSLPGRRVAHERHRLRALVLGPRSRGRRRARPRHGPPTGVRVPGDAAHRPCPARLAPEFVDYLAFSFATATAFSPTDVSAIKPWAKALSSCESLLCLALAALVIARAINVIN